MRARRSAGSPRTLTRPQAAVDVTLHPGAEFDARQVTLARAYDDTLSLKLLDYDNIGFTKKGKKVGYEQFIALAFKQ